MTAVVLCTGRARTMWPLREEKWAIELLGRPLIHHVVDRLLAAHVKEFVFVGNESNIALLRLLTMGLTRGTSHYVIQHNSSGIAGALEAAAEHLSGAFMLVGSTDLVQQDVYRAITSAKSKGDEIALLTVGTGVGDPVNILVHYHHDPSLLLHALRRVDRDPRRRYESGLELLIAEGRRVRAVQHNGIRGPLKYPWDLLPLMDHLLQDLHTGISPTAQVSDLARLEGAVYVADGARVLEHAVIRGPAYIGEGAVVGNSALLRGGVSLGPRSVVGFSTEVKHSHIGADCQFHTNYIGDSIVGDCCSFGGGAVTANLRLDNEHVRAQLNGTGIDTGFPKLGVIMGSGCRVGSNATLMPGVLVGPGAVIGPQVCLTANLSEGQRARASCGYRVEETPHSQVA